MRELILVVYLSIISSVFLLTLIVLFLTIRQYNKTVLLLKRERDQRVQKQDAIDARKLMKAFEQKRNPKYCKTCESYIDGRCKKHNKLMYFNEEGDEWIAITADELPKVNEQDWCDEHSDVK